jgi:hypothetical protein
VSNVPGWAMIYAAYSPRCTEAEARAAFAKRYGCEPQVVKRLNVVLVGPKPETKQGGTCGNQKG